VAYQVELHVRQGTCRRRRLRLPRGSGQSRGTEDVWKTGSCT
jgi:hypothetical protein